MLLVPEDDALIVEARVPPQSIDQLQIGQRASLRFSAFNVRTTPEIFGTVSAPGGSQKSYVSIANRQAEIMMRIASEFGFTPASRSRISAPVEREPGLFDLFANSGDDQAG